MFGKMKSVLAKPQPPPPPPPVAESKNTAKPKPKPDMLKEGQVIMAQSGSQYVVEKILGRGGFGEVYKVYPTHDLEKTFAMKVETQKCKPGHETMLRLKIELYVFETIAKSTTVDKTHFVMMQDRGKTADFKYYVMDIIWVSLKEAIEDVCKGNISPATKITIARQTLKGIEALHQLGFLHRDIKTANYAVGLPPKDNIIYLLDFGIARPYRDPNGGVKPARAHVPFMGSPRYSSIRALEKQDQSMRDDLEVWTYMMLEIYDKSNIWWYGTADLNENIRLKKMLQNEAKKHHKSGKLKVPAAYVPIITLIKEMNYGYSGEFFKFRMHLDDIVKQEKINMNVPLEWLGKKPKSPEKKRKKQPESSDKKESSTGAPPSAPSLDWEQKITFDPPLYMTYKPIPEKQSKYLNIMNNNSHAVCFKVKTLRNEVFRMNPVLFTVEPNRNRRVRLVFHGCPAGEKPMLKDRITLYMALLPKVAPTDMEGWREKWKVELEKCKKNKRLLVHYEGYEIPVDKPDKNEKEEEEYDMKEESTRKGRKKESKKRKRESRKRNDDMDPEEVVITMEEIKKELMREKKRRMTRTERTEDRKDYEDDDSQDDYSDEDEEYRRRRKSPKGRKKRSRDRNPRTENNSDRDERGEMDDRDERDDKDDRKRDRRRKGNKRTRGSKKKYDENDGAESGQEPKKLEPDEPGEKKDRDRKRNKDDKPDEKKWDAIDGAEGVFGQEPKQLEKRDEKRTDNDSKKNDDKTPQRSKSKTIEAPPPDDGAYMALGDANAMEKDQGTKDKKGGDDKKDQQKSPAATPEQAKKADEAAPVKKEPVDAKKK